MDWRRRLLELTLAGGTLALTGCPFVGGGTCNANPDPCCNNPNGTLCSQKNACVAGGGTWDDSFERCDTDSGTQAGNDAGDANTRDIASDTTPSDVGQGG